MSVAALSYYELKLIVASMEEPLRMLKSNHFVVFVHIQIEKSTQILTNYSNALLCSFVLLHLTADLFVYFHRKVFSEIPHLSDSAIFVPLHSQNAGQTCDK